jgi:hypothetical protein
VSVFPRSMKSRRACVRSTCSRASGRACACRLSGGATATSTASMARTSIATRCTAPAAAAGPSGKGRPTSATSIPPNRRRRAAASTVPTAAAASRASGSATATTTAVTFGTRPAAVRTLFYSLCTSLITISSGFFLQIVLSDLKK